MFLETDPATKSEENATLELTEAMNEANQCTTTLSEELDNTARLLEKKGSVQLHSQAKLLSMREQRPMVIWEKLRSSNLT